jgi:dimeric dUTPase (all-alpha-NTP-PPase superfamily)
MWDIQVNFNKKVFLEKYGKEFESLSEEDRITYCKDFFNHTVVEIVEVMQEVPFKMHTNQNKKINKENLLEEFVDVFKYLIGWVQLMGFSRQEFENKFFDKSKIVEERFKKQNGG